ncbi:hypothetical protein AJ88_29350 [Mesorhizobium amorphae CCBAU 01583]|nr:hypothetical protein AJ88_29350 [Mesorhizobium amorphae CCBAU 01583]
MRSAVKLECISAAAERAQARALASTGQTPWWRSARYSTMASESQTAQPSSTRHGTRPLGENGRYKFQLDPVGNGVRRSSNGMSRVRISTHGRSDHDE